MILIIDNYDSFVYNLARYVAELGFEPVVYRNDAIDLDQIAALSPSHIILSPGPAAPDEAGICLALIQRFMGSIPILGVCLGHQAIAQACGGRVTRAEQPMHGKATAINHHGKGLFQGLPNPLNVGRYHSLIASREDFPEQLEITALCQAGEIMAMQHRKHPVYGVQFHPESILTEFGHALLSHFLEIPRPAATPFYKGANKKRRPKAPKYLKGELTIKCR